MLFIENSLFMNATFFGAGQGFTVVAPFSASSFTVTPSSGFVAGQVNIRLVKIA
jgi:hypothetical protein